jgi:hypothetical protein
MSDGLSPEPPYLSIGLYVDRLTESAALEATVEALVAAGGRPTGSAWAGPPVGDEGFEYVSDLELGLFQWPVTTPGRRAYRVGCEVDGLAEVAVTYAAAPPPDRHPIVLHLSAGIFGIPSEHWSEEEHEEATEYRHRVGELLISLTDALDPAYAVVEIEEPIPTPRDLVAGVKVPLADIYVSSRILGGSHELAELLRQAFAQAVVRQTAQGELFSAWLLTSNNFSTPREALAKQAAAALGRHLVTRGE